MNPKIIKDYRIIKHQENIMEKNYFEGFRSINENELPIDFVVVTPNHLMLSLKRIIEKHEKMVAKEDYFSIKMEYSVTFSVLCSQKSIIKIILFISRRITVSSISICFLTEFVVLVSTRSIIKS